MKSVELSEKEVKSFNKLYQSKYRKEEGLFIVEGDHLVKEALELGLLVKAYTIKEDGFGTLISERSMKKICKTDTLVRSIGIARIRTINNLSDKILLLDAIQDPGNMGTLLRTAKSFGFDSIILGDGCCDIYNDKVVRSCQGAILKLNFIKSNIENFIKQNKEYYYYGTDVVSGVDVENVQPQKKLGLILGNEGRGLSQEIKELCQQNLYIKLNDMESLNVGVAGGILMYLLNR